MSTIYRMCGEDVQEMARKVMRDHHAPLARAKVTVICLYADAGVEEDGRPKLAVKLNGYPCAATVRKTAPKDRAAGLADVIITIDYHVWGELSKESRLALMDHELAHLLLDLSEKLEVRLDCADRPIMEMCLHDWHLSGFHAVVERHGMAALEAIELVRLMESDRGQSYFKFMMDIIPAKARKSKAA